MFQIRNYHDKSTNQIPDWELLHSIVGLYDTYLPEVTSEVIYSNVITAYTFTVVFIRDIEGKKKVVCIDID